MNNNKLYPCKNCQALVKIRSKGLCARCSAISKGSQVKRYKIKVQSQKNKEKKQNKTLLMKPYWEYHISVLEKGKSCENCGVGLSPSVVYIAHILPKQRHFSVMDNLLNCSYMCALCHNRYDRIQSTSQVYLMNVFPTVLKRYLEFRESVEENSIYKDVFEDYINENK